MKGGNKEDCGEEKSPKSSYISQSFHNGKTILRDSFFLNLTTSQERETKLHGCQPCARNISSVEACSKDLECFFRSIGACQGMSGESKEIQGQRDSSPPSADLRRREQKRKTKGDACRMSTSSCATIEVDNACVYVLDHGPP